MIVRITRMSGIEIRISNLEKENTELKHEIETLRKEFENNKDIFFFRMSRISHIANDAYTMILGAREDIGELSIDSEYTHELLSKYNLLVAGECVSMILLMSYLYSFLKK